MKKTLSFYPFLFLFLTACEFRQVEMASFQKVNDKFEVEFNYSSNSFVPGFVRFINNSKGDVKSEWNFGSLDASGKTYTSDYRSPNFIYPKNGFYRVTLTIYNEKNQKLTIAKSVRVASIDTGGGGRGGSK
jgi:PKD repeat protein